MLLRLASMAMVAVGLMLGGLNAATADVLLRHVTSGSYVRHQGNMLIANAHERGAARLQLVPAGRGRVALRAPDGRFARVPPGETQVLVADSRQVGVRETFELVNMGPVVGLRSAHNNRMVQVGRNGFLEASARNFNDNTRFRVIEVANNRPQPPVGQPGPGRPGADLTGRWHDVQVPGHNGRLQGPPRGSRMYFNIRRNDQVTFSINCNEITARMDQQRGGRVEFRRVQSTSQRCERPVAEFERGVIAGLEQAHRYEERRGEVTFLDRRGRPVMRISR